ncbi:hypothetical protein C8T65DRAFT_642900, partial [Cerioporus squamosus]
MQTRTPGWMRWTPPPCPLCAPSVSTSARNKASIDGFWWVDVFVLFCCLARLGLCVYRASYVRQLSLGVMVLRRAWLHGLPIARHL